MSNSDNTRPYKVQEADRRTLWVRAGRNFPVAVIGGFAGMKRHGKPMRKGDARKRRQRDREVTHLAKYLNDKDAVNTRPIPADRRSLRAA